MYGLCMFVGIDHGTLAIRIAIIKNNSKPITFALSRNNKSLSLLNELKKYVKLSSISLIGLTYSMGDAISQITPIILVKNRGVLSIEGVGKKTHVGTKIFDEVKESELPTILIPGLHRNCDFLDERFRLLYSHHSSPSKVCAAYHCMNTLNKKIKIKNAVVSDISSSTSSILIKNEKIVGAIDACLGSQGIQYGPLDVEAIRKIDEGIKANEAFSQAGIMKSKDYEDFFKDLENKDKKAIESMNAMATAVSMEISGIATLLESIDAIILTGSIGSMAYPFNFVEAVKKYVEKRAKVYALNGFSAAMGAAGIAEDVHNGAEQILGINVHESMRSYLQDNIKIKQRMLV